MTDDEPTPIRPDQVARAIDAVDAAETAAQGPIPGMAEIPVLIQSTGRPAVLVVPLDITEAEVLGLASWVCKGMLQHIAANLVGGRPSPIVDALGLPLRRT